MNEKKQVTVAILGASGNVGRMFINILEERNFPIKEIKFLASAKSKGQKIKFKNQEFVLEEASLNSFKGVDIVLASCGGTASKELIPHAVKAGAIVIDNSSAFRMDENVPLVVAGVNDHAIKRHKGIIANPNCTTAQLVPTLKVIDEIAGLKRVIVSTYQSVSGAGKAAMDELLEQTRYSSKTEKPWEEKYKTEGINRKFAFNVIPHIDVFSTDGYTKEEIKVINESRKILELPELKITCTAVRVPVFIGHSESVNVEIQKNISREDIIIAFKKAPLINVIDDVENNQYPMPIDIAGTDPVYVGRVRKDSSCQNAFNYWVVADNLRIGAALNAIRIAELLVK